MDVLATEIYIEAIMSGQQLTEDVGFIDPPPWTSATKSRIEAIMGGQLSTRDI